MLEVPTAIHSGRHDTYTGANTIAFFDYRMCYSTLLCFMNIRVEHIQDLKGIVDAVVSLLHKGYRVFLLQGELGAGKTTFVQNLCRELGVSESISSPTFSLINAYDSPVYGTIYHMDLYRIEKPGDLVQLGLEEYLESGQICLIEWPAIAQEYFYPPYVHIGIEFDKDNIRTFRITTHDTVDA